MNFTKVEHVFVGSIWKGYRNFPIDGANASGVKKWPLPSVHPTLGKKTWRNQREGVPSPIARWRSVALPVNHVALTVEST